MNFFITGTDTGVGKTYVLSLLLRYLISQGKAPRVMKPIETGCVVKKGKLYPPDAAMLAAITGQDIDEVCPYRFRHPLAPYVAAKLEKKPIVPGKIKKCFEMIAKPSTVHDSGSNSKGHGSRKGNSRCKFQITRFKSRLSSPFFKGGTGDYAIYQGDLPYSLFRKEGCPNSPLHRSTASPSPVFVEGAGGLMVPVTRNFFMIDIPELLGLSVILVARLGLGTINHTLLSIAELRRRRIPVAGIILNDTCGIKSVSERTNPGVLKTLTDVPVLGVIPFKFNDTKKLNRQLDLSLFV